MNRRSGDYLKLFEKGDAGLESLGAQGKCSDLRPKVPDKLLNDGGKSKPVLTQEVDKERFPFKQPGLDSAPHVPNRAEARRASPTRAPRKVQWQPR